MMSGKEIFILGSQNYKNEILAHYLEHERGIRCRILPPDGALVSGSADTNAEAALFLIDCSETGVERYFLHLQLDGDRPPFQHPVSIFNARRDSGIEEKALQTGVKGIFYEGLPLEVFIEGILEILNGGIWFPEDLIVRWISSHRRRVILHIKEKPFLSSREVEIIGKLAEGLTNDEIAEQLHISLFTVKTHLQNIYRKIKVTKRTQAILWVSKNLARNQVDLSWLGETDVERKAVSHHSEDSSNR
jgi:LuxR family transcriptional regulator of csgAB operon